MPVFGYFTNNELAALLQQVLANQARILANQAQGAKVMSQISDAVAAAQAEVANNTTVQGSAVTLLQQLLALYTAAVANAADDAAAVAAVKALTAQLQQNDQALAAAVVANTPAPSAPPTP